ncbi:hypothetical protein ASE49_03425 [Novosphingobium sp. Leaf2]|nr:hypothetical protein ASE49_03425 [Novosphingobium sp. Leaf2]
MDRGMPHRGVKPFQIVFLLVEATFIVLTVAALLDALMGRNWGLGWTVFFIGFIASAWGAVSYPVCCGCYGWDHKH